MSDSAVGFVRACVREREASVGAGNAARPSCRAAERALSGENHLDAILRRGRVENDFHLLRNIPLAV